MSQPSKAAGPNPTKEPIRVVTVRMPASMHEQLVKAAHGWCVSLNQHCLDLLQAGLDKDAEVAVHDRTALKEFRQRLSSIDLDKICRQLERLKQYAPREV
jgi:hypothetical protein